jgi:hypothetical protein
VLCRVTINGGPPSCLRQFESTYKHKAREEAEAFRTSTIKNLRWLYFEQPAKNHIEALQVHLRRSSVQEFEKGWVRTTEPVYKAAILVQQGTRHEKGPSDLHLIELLEKPGILKTKELFTDYIDDFFISPPLSRSAIVEAAVQRVRKGHGLLKVKPIQIAGVGHDLQKWKVIIILPYLCKDQPKSNFCLQ